MQEVQSGVLCEDIETLLFVEDHFRKTARKLLYDTGAELFDNFEEILQGSAERKWNTLVAPLANNQRTVARFNLVMEEFYLRYCGNEARNTGIRYLRSEAVRKPRNSTPRQHQERIETLWRYTNRLPGQEPPLTEAQLKTILFDSFPRRWK